jgi:hypothetical protein
MSSFSYDTSGDVSLSAIVSALLNWFRRNLLWLMLGAVGGGTISYFINEAQPKEYTSSLVGYANNLDDLRIRELIQYLQILRATGDVQQLAKLLGISEEEAKDIVAISASPNNVLEADLPPFPPRETKVMHYQISATVHRPELFPKIERGIVSYVDNVPPIKKRLLEMRESTLRRIQREQEEIQYLEETKKHLESDNRPIQVLDIGTLSRHVMDLTEKLEDNQLFYALLEHEMVLTRPMEIVNKPSSPGKYRAFGFGAATGFFSVLGIMGMLALVRFSKQKD